MDKPFLHILHIADIHFWRVVWNPLLLLNKRFLGNLNVLLRRRFEFAQERAENMLEILGQTGAHLALFTGDFTSTALEEEFAQARAFIEALKEKGMDIALLPGNHDVYTFESVRKKRFETFLGEFVPPQGYPAALPVGKEHRLLLIPTAKPNFLSARGRVSPQVIDWTQRELASTQTAPVFVAGHYPLLHGTSSYSSPPSHRMEHAKLMRDNLGQIDKPILYVCGHVHRFSVTHDPLYPNLLHVSTGGLFRVDPTAGSLGEYTEILIDQNTVLIRRNVCKSCNLWTTQDFRFGFTAHTFTT